MPLNIESYADRCINLISLRPQSNVHMLIFPSVVPDAINSPVFPFDTTVTQGEGTAHAVAFVTCENKIY